MADQRETIEILIKARNETAGALRAVQAELSRFDKQLEGLRGVSDKLDQALNKVETKLTGIGRTGDSSASAATRAFDDLHTSLEEVEKQTLKSHKALDDLAKTRNFATMKKESADAFAEIDRLAKKLSDPNLTRAQSGAIEQSINTARGKLKAFNQEFVDSYIAKSKEAAVNSGRYIIAERARVEQEITKLVRNAEKDRQHAVEESLAKIVDAQSRAAKLAPGQDLGVQGSLSRALGQVDARSRSELVRSIQEVGLATEKEAIEIDRAAVAERVRTIEALRGAEARKKAAGDELVAIHEQRIAKEREITQQSEYIKQISTLDELQRRNSVNHLRDLQSQHEVLGRIESDLKRIQTAEDKQSGFSRFFQGAKQTDADLKNLSRAFNGFQIAVVVKYFQALASAVIGLGGELISLSSSAIGAGAALGGALAAGAMQAIGPLVLLAAVVQRFQAIQKILALRQTIQGNSLHTGKSQEKQAASDTGELTNALQAQQDAQRSLTQARVDAARKLEDLIDAEERARLAAEASELALQDSERARRNALSSGGSEAFLQADLSVQEARLSHRGDQTTLRRAGTDLAQAKRQGISGDPGVISAQHALADAERQVAKAHQGTAAAADSATAAQDRLRELLGKLTPAERDLYNNIVKLQDVYRKAFRPVTDVIIKAFSGAVDQIIPLFKDPKLMGAFGSLASQISTSIESITKHFVGRKSIFEFFMGQAGANIGPITKIFLNLTDAIENIGKAATPIFNFIIDALKMWSDHLKVITGDSSLMKEFFTSTKKDLEAWANLLSGIWDVFKAIFFPAESYGQSEISKLGDDLKSFADHLRTNSGNVKKFFSDSQQIFKLVGSVILNVGRQLAKAFSVENVKNLATFMNAVIVPALGNAIRSIGILTNLFHFFLSLPIASNLAQFATSLLAIGFGLKLIGHAIQSVRDLAGQIIGLKAAGQDALAPWQRGLASFGLAFVVFSQYMDTAHAALTAFFAALALTKLFAFIRALEQAKEATILLKIAAMETPWGLILGVIGTVASAIFGFGSASDEAKVSTQDLTDALNQEADALRTIRDLALEAKDAKLAVKQANLRVQETETALTKAQKEAISKSGPGGVKVTKEERQAIEQAKLDVEQAKQDLKRSQIELADLPAKQAGERQQAQQQISDAVNKGKQKVQQDRNEKNSVDDLTAAIKHQNQLRDEQEQLVANGRISRKQANEAEVTITANIISLQDQLTQKQKDATADQKLFKRAVNQAAEAVLAGKGSVDDYGITVSDVMQYIATAGNRVLKSLGSSAHIEKVAAYVAKSASGATSYDNNSTVLRAEGGIIPGFGNRDTVDVKAAPGEGILNRHQMPIVDYALRTATKFRGGLADLWSSITTPHYMASGGAVPNFYGHPSNVAAPVAKLIGIIERRFPGMVVTSTRDHSYLTTSGNVSDHSSGHAVDMAGSNSLMYKVSEWIKSSGLYRSIKQGIHNPNLAINAGQILSPPGIYAGHTWAEHANHIHLAAYGPIGSFIGGMIDTIKKMSIRGPKSALTSLAKALEKKLRGAANKFIAKQTPTGGGFSGTSAEGGLSANQLADLWVQAGGPKAMAPIMAQIALAESGGVSSATNVNTNGTIDRGLWQINSSWGKYSRYGELANALSAVHVWKTQGLSAWTSDKAFEALVRGKHATGPGQFAKGGKVPFLGYYKDGGSVPQDGLAYLHQGEYVMPKVTAKFHDDIDTKAISSDFHSLVKNLGKHGSIAKIIKALNDLTADDGPINQLAQAVSDYKDKLASSRLAKRFSINKKGVVTENFNDYAEAKGELADARSVEKVLKTDEADAQQGLHLASRASAKIDAVAGTKGMSNSRVLGALQSTEGLINTLKKKKKLTSAEKKTLAAAQSHAAVLRKSLAGRAGKKKAATQLSAVKGQLAQNESDIYDKQQGVEQAAFDSVGTQFDTSADDTAMQVATALGNTSEARGYASRINDTNIHKKSALTDLLGKTTNPEVKKSIQDEINNLSISIAQASAQTVQDQVDDVDKTASGQLAKAGLKTRAADLLQKSKVGFLDKAFALRGSALEDTGKALLQQRNGLQDILGGLDPNSDKAKELRDRIDDLNQQIDDNTQAIKENNTALIQAHVDAITSKSGFITGAVNSGIGIVNAVSALTQSGANNPLLKKLLTAGGNALASAGGGLRDQLTTLLGYDPLAGLTSPDDIASKLVDLSQMDTSNMSQSEQDTFRGLINALLDNTGAIVQNSQQLADLNGTSVQSFSSSAWQLFRAAIFDGSGGLLPQYANIPQMATGGLIRKDGLIYAHSGEIVVPANVVKSGGAGDTTIVNVTNPTEVLDPGYLAEVLAFKRATARAT